MFSAIELYRLQNLIGNLNLEQDDYLKHRLTVYSRLMIEVEKKTKELYELKKPRLDTCGTSLHKVWVMTDMMFGPSIHLELLGEHWSFWISDDNWDVIESHKHENHRKS